LRGTSNPYIRRSITYLTRRKIWASEMGFNEESWMCWRG